MVFPEVLGFFPHFHPVLVLKRLDLFPVTEAVGVLQQSD